MASEACGVRDRATWGAGSSYRYVGVGVQLQGWMSRGLQGFRKTQLYAGHTYSY